MKKEIADYIEIIVKKNEPLTDTQARIVAYWEFVDFQCDIDEPRSAVINKLLRECKK